MRRLTKKGFTIVELMIATVIFSVVLLVMTVGIIQIGRAFYKGLISSKTQEAARGITDEIGQAIQFSGGEIIPNTATATPATKGTCISSRLYSYTLGQQLNGSPRRFVATPVSTCSASVTALSAAGMASPPAGSRELLGDKMRVANFSVTQISPSTNPNLYRIQVRVVYGDDDLLTNPNDPTASCKTGAGSHFCAVSDISTTVQKRL